MKIYLACPYSHPDKAVREHRFHIANKAAAKLIGRGHIVFSPISHSHPIANEMDNHLSKIWLEQDRAFVEWADCLAIVDIDGWKESSGIAEEFKWMAAAGKPTYFLNYFLGEYTILKEIKEIEAYEENELRKREEPK